MRTVTDVTNVSTIRKVSQVKDGRIHTADGKHAFAFSTMAAISNPTRYPTMGTVFAFLRADHSWHGRLPFAAERRVVQMA